MDQSSLSDRLSESAEIREITLLSKISDELFPSGRYSLSPSISRMYMVAVWSNPILEKIFQSSTVSHSSSSSKMEGYFPLEVFRQHFRNSMIGSWSSSEKSWFESSAWESILLSRRVLPCRISTSMNEKQESISHSGKNTGSMEKNSQKMKCNDFISMFLLPSNPSLSVSREYSKRVHGPSRILYFYLSTSRIFSLVSRVCSRVELVSIGRGFSGGEVLLGMLIFCSDWSRSVWILATTPSGSVT